MDINVKYLIAAISGWLLVQVSGTVEFTFDYFLEARFIGRTLGTFIALVGWVTTVVFSALILINIVKSR